MATKCKVCLQAVYKMDPQINLDGTILHKSCAKCDECKCQISLNNFAKDDSGEKLVLLCKTHYFRKFREGGGYIGEDKFNMKSPSRKVTSEFTFSDRDSAEATTSDKVSNKNSVEVATSSDSLKSPVVNRYLPNASASASETSSVIHTSDSFKSPFVKKYLSNMTGKPSISSDTDSTNVLSNSPFKSPSQKTSAENSTKSESKSSNNLATIRGSFTTPSSTTTTTTTSESRPGLIKTNSLPVMPVTSKLSKESSGSHSPTPLLRSVASQSRINVNDKFKKLGGSSGPTCYNCKTIVYSVESLSALGQVWHKKCFVCGGNDIHGCHKALTLESFIGHNSQPYCMVCIRKVQAILPTNKKASSSNANDIPVSPYAHIKLRSVTSTTPTVTPPVTPTVTLRKSKHMVEITTASDMYPSQDHDHDDSADKEGTQENDIATSYEHGHEYDTTTTNDDTTINERESNEVNNTDTIHIEDSADPIVESKPLYDISLQFSPLHKQAQMLRESDEYELVDHVPFSGRRLNGSIISNYGDDHDGNSFVITSARRSMSQRDTLTRTISKDGAINLNDSTDPSAPNDTNMSMNSTSNDGTLTSRDDPASNPADTGTQEASKSDEIKKSQSSDVNDALLTTVEVTEYPTKLSKVPSLSLENKENTEDSKISPSGTNVSRTTSYRSRIKVAQPTSPTAPDEDLDLPEYVLTARDMISDDNDDYDEKDRRRTSSSSPNNIKKTYENKSPRNVTFQNLENSDKNTQENTGYTYEGNNIEKDEKDMMNGNSNKDGVISIIELEASDTVHPIGTSSKSYKIILETQVESPITKDTTSTNFMMSPSEKIKVESDNPIFSSHETIYVEDAEEIDPLSADEKNTGTTIGNIQPNEKEMKDGIIIHNDNNNTNNDDTDSIPLYETLSRKLNDEDNARLMQELQAWEDSVGKSSHDEGNSPSITTQQHQSDTHSSIGNTSGTNTSNHTSLNRASNTSSIDIGDKQASNVIASLRDNESNPELSTADSTASYSNKKPVTTSTTTTTNISSKAPSGMPTTASADNQTTTAASTSGNSNKKSPEVVPAKTEKKKYFCCF